MILAAPILNIHIYSYTFCNGETDVCCLICSKLARYLPYSIAVTSSMHTFFKFSIVRTLICQLRQMIQEGARVHNLGTPVGNIPPLIRYHLQILILPITTPADHERDGLPHRRACRISQRRHIHVAPHTWIEVQVLIVFGIWSHFANILDHDRRTILVYLPKKCPKLVGSLRQQSRRLIRRPG